MPLPSFNPPGKNTTPDKQMAMMRNYLSLLKDQTETELFDIKWDNLSQSLRNKINSLDKVLQQTSDDLQYTTEYISANVVTADYIETHFASIGALEAVVARIGVIEADYIEADAVLTGNLEAAVARIGEIEANYIKASYITAAVIASKFTTSSSAEFKWINVADIKAKNINADYAGRTIQFTPQQMNGKIVWAAEVPT